MVTLLRQVSDFLKNKCHCPSSFSEPEARGRVLEAGTGAGPARTSRSPGFAQIQYHLSPHHAASPPPFPHDRFVWFTHLCRWAGQRFRRSNPSPHPALPGGPRPKGDPEPQGWPRAPSLDWAAETPGWAPEARGALPAPGPGGPSDAKPAGPNSLPGRMQARAGPHNSRVGKSHALTGDVAEEAEGGWRPSREHSKVAGTAGVYWNLRAGPQRGGARGRSPAAAGGEGGACGWDWEEVLILVVSLLSTPFTPVFLAKPPPADVLRLLTKPIVDFRH